MFTKNTEFQKHIKCVEMIEKAIETHPGELIEILDIVFKWGNFRMSDSSNTKLIGAFFDFYQKRGENAYGRRALMTLTFLKPPIPEAPTRRNANAEWSIRKDVFDARLTVGQLAALDETTTTRV